MLSHYEVQIEFDLAALETEFFKAIEVIKQLPFIDGVHFIHNAINENKSILAEGAQGSLLDVDFGTYPFVTSSTTSAAGACTGLGIAPNQIAEVYGIMKAYITRVGSGPFPTELFDADGARMAKVGHEFGATTGRPRRCGWLDLVALKYAIQLNGVTQMSMMKADVLSGFDTIKACVAYQYKGEKITHFPYSIDENDVTPIYKEFAGWQNDITKIRLSEEIPRNLEEYIAFIEDYVGVPVKILSVGPDREQTLFL